VTAVHAIQLAYEGPSTDSLRRSLPRIGEHLSGALDDLHARPSPEAAEWLAAELDGARRAVLRFRERLLAEERSDDR
jgi:hypothetical protein